MPPRYGELAYLSDVARRSKPLSRAHELELARRFRESRDRRAADQLARGHLGMVITMALKYRHYGLSVADLVAEGNCGLVAALARFDPERGHRFSTYARHWVRAYMLEHVARSWHVAGGGATAVRPSVFFKLRRERARIAALMGENTGAAEGVLAGRMSVSIPRLQALLQRLDARDVSIELPPGSEGHGWQPERLICEETPEDSYLQSEQHAAAETVVSAALKALDAREAYIARNRLMADGEMSLAEIARYFGISRERARQLESRAKQKLARSAALSESEVVRELWSPC